VGGKPTAPEDASTPEEKALLTELAAEQGWLSLANTKRHSRVWWRDLAQRNARISAIKSRLSELRREREAQEKSDPAA
jgi:hypothetical protein